MSVPTTTPSLTLEDFFSTTLSGDIIATDTVIPVNAAPTGNEGFLVIDQDNGSREIIYYTSKGASSVTCPSAAAGRGQGGTTAASHSSGATVKMNMVAQLWKELQNGNANVGQNTRVKELANSLPFVLSGGVLTADAAGSTRAGSLTALVCYINGRRISVPAFNGHSFTASKDTYVDVLDNGDNTGTGVFTEVTNNAASPALASNSIRLAIVVTGASSIAAAASINQGQEDCVLPIASSIPYTVTDSLGNLICPRDPQNRRLGYRQIVANPTGITDTAMHDIPGLSMPIIAPGNRSIKLSLVCPGIQNTTAGNLSTLGIAEGSTSISTSIATNPATNGNVPLTVSSPAIKPSAGLHTYKAQAATSAGTVTPLAGNTPGAGAVGPMYIMAELAN